MAGRLCYGDRFMNVPRKEQGVTPSHRFSRLDRNQECLRHPIDRDVIRFIVNRDLFIAYLQLDLIFGKDIDQHTADDGLEERPFQRPPTAFEPSNENFRYGRSLPTCRIREKGANVFPQFIQ